MGVKKTVNVRGLEVKDAYNRIDRLNINGSSIFVSVGTYASKKAAGDGEQAFEQTEITTSLDAIEETKESVSFAKAYGKIVNVHEKFVGGVEE